MPIESPIDGGCDFATDHRLSALETEVIWLPALDPSVVSLAPSSNGGDGFDLRFLAPYVERIAEEGAYLVFGRGFDRDIALVAPGLSPTDRTAAIVPVDGHLPARLAAVLRLWRRVTGKSSERPTGTPAKRYRLSMMLRALDARANAANRRDIAVALFGRDAVPPGVAFDDHHLRSRISRLVKEGLGLSTGGYRRLISETPGSERET